VKGSHHAIASLQHHPKKGNPLERIFPRTRKKKTFKPDFAPISPRTILGGRKKRGRPEGHENPEANRDPHRRKRSRGSRNLKTTSTKRCKGNKKFALRRERLAKGGAHAKKKEAKVNPLSKKKKTTGGTMGERSGKRAPTCGKVRAQHLRPSKWFPCASGQTA